MKPIEYEGLTHFFSNHRDKMNKTIKILHLIYDIENIRK